MLQAQRLAILAATLFLLRCCPLQTWALQSVTTPRQYSSNPSSKRRRATATTPLAPRTLACLSGGTVVSVTCCRPRQLPCDFASHYCQSGRFSQRHKLGRCGRATMPVGPSERDAWGAALAALAASGTVLACQTYRPTASTATAKKSRKRGKFKPDVSRKSLGTEQGSMKRPWSRKRPNFENRQRQSMSSKAVTDHDDEEEIERVLTRLLADAETKDPPESTADAHIEPSRRGGNQRGRHRKATPKLPPQSRRQRPPRRGPLLMLSQQPAALVRRVQHHIRASASSLSDWTATRAGGVTEAVGGAASSVANGARVGQAGFGQWTSRRATELSGITAEAGRHAENAFLMVRSSDFGSEFGGRLLDIRRRIRRGGTDSSDGTVGSDKEEGIYEGSRLALLMDQTVQNVVDVVGRDGWEHVATTNGVLVYRQYIALGPDGVPVPADRSTFARKRAGTSSDAAEERGTGDGTGLAMAGLSGDDGNRNAPQFACVKATAILDVPPDVVYRLFADNSRVSEYNEHCKEVMDLETLSADCKITWAASGRMGPFKARDFCTLVHFRTLSDGTLAQVSRPMEHPAAPRSNKYVRSEILLAGNFMRPVPGDPSRTEFLMITHVNPGGAAETRAGAMLVNSLCTSSPVNFIRRLEVSAKKLMRELDEAGGEGGVELNRGEVTEGTGGNMPPPAATGPPPVVETEPALPGAGEQEGGSDWGNVGLEPPDEVPQRPPRFSDKAEGSSGFCSDFTNGDAGCGEDTVCG